MSSELPPNLVDLHFMDARCKLIDVAAFLDRIQRHGGEGDYRVRALREAISCLHSETPDRARSVLESLSDPSERPIEAATIQGAFGAYDSAANAPQT